MDAGPAPSPSPTPSHSSPIACGPATSIINNPIGRRGTGLSSIAQRPHSVFPYKPKAWWLPPMWAEVPLASVVLSAIPSIKPPSKSVTKIKVPVKTPPPPPRPVPPLMTSVPVIHQTVRLLHSRVPVATSLITPPSPSAKPVPPPRRGLIASPSTSKSRRQPPTPSTCGSNHRQGHWYRCSPHYAQRQSTSTPCLPMTDLLAPPV